MKIYNKKEFFGGFISLLLGLMNLSIGLRKDALDGQAIILIAALFLFAGEQIIRSLSQKKTREEKLEEREERNQLIQLKSRSKSFGLTQHISLFLMLAMMVMGKVSGDTGFIGVGVGLSFAFTISMFAEIFTYIYYEAKN